MDNSVTIPGVAGEVSGKPGMLGPTILVAGRPAPRKGRNVTLPGADGNSVAATLKGGGLDPYPVLEVAGVRYPTGPTVPMWLKILAVLPIALIAVGGLVGALVGLGGVFVNMSTLRSERSAGVKAALSVAVLVAAIVVWVLLASLIRR